MVRFNPRKTPFAVSPKGSQSASSSPGPMAPIGDGSGLHP
jgi:hypothetical protein